jgi:hypothetical protein
MKRRLPHKDDDNPSLVQLKEALKRGYVYVCHSLFLIQWEHEVMLMRVFTKHNICPDFITKAMIKGTGFIDVKVHKSTICNEWIAWKLRDYTILFEEYKYSSDFKRLVSRYWLVKMRLECSPFYEYVFRDFIPIICMFSL